MSAENFLLLRSELIDLMAKNLDVHLNIVWSSNGLLLAAIGWIITSKEARNYIGKGYVPVNCCYTVYTSS